MGAGFAVLRGARFRVVVRGSATASERSGGLECHTPCGEWEAMREPTTVRFAHVVRSLAAAARAEGLTAPSFRSPPGVHGAVRTVRRRGDGTATVAVEVKDRPWPAVLGDLVEGVVVANGLRGPAADRARRALWRAVDPGEAAA